MTIDGETQIEYLKLFVQPRTYASSGEHGSNITKITGMTDNDGNIENGVFDSSDYSLRFDQVYPNASDEDYNMTRWIAKYNKSNDTVVEGQWWVIDLLLGTLVNVGEFTLARTTVEDMLNRNKNVGEIDREEEKKALARKEQEKLPDEYDYLYLHVLRGIYIHNSNHSFHLILGLNYACIFPGVGMGE